LDKRCKCGKKMEMKLHTIMYSSKVEIGNVPVYTCDTCQKSELHKEIKSDLTSLISQLGSRPEKQQLQFDELNELAFLLRAASDRDRLKIPLEALIEERVNQLLDLLLLSRSLMDMEWTQDIHRRLLQITNYSLVKERVLGE
jgi:hypothetical protein